MLFSISPSLLLAFKSLLELVRISFVRPGNSYSAHLPPLFFIPAGLIIVESSVHRSCSFFSHLTMLFRDCGCLYPFSKIIIEPITVFFLFMRSTVQISLSCFDQQSSFFFIDRVNSLKTQSNSKSTEFFLQLKRSQYFSD